MKKSIFLNLLTFTVLLAGSHNAFAGNYYKSYSAGTHTIEFLDAPGGTAGQFNVKEDGDYKTTGSGTSKKNAVYDALGGSTSTITYAIKVSGANTSVTVTFNTTKPISLTKPIELSAGTLTICLGDNHTASSCVLRRNASYIEEMFHVSGGFLNMYGKAWNNTLFISGNGKFVMPTTRYDIKQGSTTVKGYTMPALAGGDDGNVMSEAAMIFIEEGRVQLNNVELAYNYNNLSFSSSNKSRGGAIRFQGSKGGTLEIYNIQIHDCCARSSGAMIYYANTSDAEFSMTGCTVQRCFTYSDMSVSGTTEASAIRNTGTDLTKTTISGCKFYDNKSNRSGGVICWNGAQVDPISISECKFQRNEGDAGGAIALYASADIKKTEILENKSYGSGGGIWSNTYSCNAYIGGSKGKFHPHDQSLTFDSETKIYHNEATASGGGVAYFASAVRNGVTEKGGVEIVLTNNDGNPISLSLKIAGAQIYNNIAVNGGGGFYFEKAENCPDSYITDLNVSYGAIYSNSSTYVGGAFSVKGKIPVNIGNTEGKEMSIYGNSAGTDGGAFYINTTAIPGKDNVTITNCTIGNNADANNHNRAGRNGGAIFLNGGTAKIKGGAVQYNDATSGNGGAIFMNGGTIDVQGGTLQSNKSVNGGAIYLAPGAQMTYTDGLIINNKALVGEATSDFTTAYNGGNGTGRVIGCGGGVYLEKGTSEKKTTLTISVKDSFGLYGNTADKAGDDIVAEGVNTSITIPNVNKMTLTGFEGLDYNPMWVEDYKTGDTQYMNHGIIKAEGSIVDRFQNLVNQGGVAPHLIEFNETSKTYTDVYADICLGYQILDVIVKGVNLNEKESALLILELLKDDDSVDREYPVLLTGTDAASVSRKVRNLPWGRYRVKSLQKVNNGSWQWAYTMSPTELTKDFKIGSEQDHTFEFTFTHKSGDDNIIHDEEYKVNELKK